MNDFQYTAFITYSHADARIASWLQKALETYRLPAGLAAAKHCDASRRLGRFFRDREELPAGSDLGQSIRNALQNAEHLIVICSPSSAKSHWVNAEIDEFRNHHGDGNILCLIAGGEPFASATPGEEHNECFPPSLGYRSDPLRDESKATEPIAADLRKGRDGRRLAKLKIVAGLLGVGLDALLQRDAQRRHRRMLGISTASVIGMLLMAVLSIVAIDARNDEQLRRAEAEDLIEFMLGDLRDRLDAVGRLDVLDTVGAKAIEYYSRVDLSEHSDAALGRRARAFHLLGEVDDLRGEMNAARAAFEEAYESTAELVRRSPGNGELIFDHAQSVYWVGYLDWRLGNFTGAERAFIEYLSLASQLGKIDPENVHWRAEAGHANINLGVYSLETAGPSAAVPYFQNGLAIFRGAAEFEPDNIEWQSQIAQSHAWLADAYQNAGSLSRAGEERAAEREMYRQLLADDPANRDAQLSLINSNRARAEILLQLGRIEEAIVDLREAKEYGDQLVEFEPDNGLARQFLAGIYANLGEANSHTSDAPASSALFAQARQIAAALTQIDGTVLKWRLLRYRVALQHLKYMVDNSQSGDAQLLTELNDTARELRQLGSETPEVSEIFHLFAVANYLTAILLGPDGPSAERSGHLRATIDTLEPLQATLPPRMQAVLAMAYRENGELAKAAKVAAQLARIEFNHPGYSSEQ